MLRIKRKTKSEFGYATVPRLLDHFLLNYSLLMNLSQSDSGQFVCIETIAVSIKGNQADNHAEMKAVWNL